MLRTCEELHGGVGLAEIDVYRHKYDDISSSDNGHQRAAACLGNCCTNGSVKKEQIWLSNEEDLGYCPN